MYNKNNSIPADVDIEKKLLGAMLIRGGEKIPAILNIIDVDDFYRPEHRLIFKHIIQLYSDNVELNIVSLVEDIKKSNEPLILEYTASLAYWAFTNAYALQHARIIKEKSDLRRLMNISEQIYNDAQKGMKSSAEVILDISNKLSTFNIVGDDLSKISTLKDFFSHSFKSEIEQVKEYCHRETGFSNIDDNQIFSPGLYVLGATPAAGKTTFAYQMAEQLSKNKETCIFCSYEMSKLELFTKSVSKELFKRNPQTALTAAQIRRGGSSNTLDDIVVELSNSNAKLSVIELHDESVDDLLKILRPLCMGKGKSPIVFIDYLQIIPSDKDTVKSKIDDTVRKLKIFQRDTNTTFIVISSLNRQNYTQQISFESFKESGGIEYTADVIWGLQLNVLNQFKSSSDLSKIRKEVDKAKKQQPRYIQLKCLKNRQGFNYDCFFKYYSAHDYFEPCDESEFTSDNS